MERRNVLVIGGAAGIGKEIALELAKEGNKVAVADINKQALIQSIENSNGLQDYLIPFEVDASSWESINQLARNVSDQFEQIDLLVYSAGITKKLKFTEIDWKLWKKTMAVNLHGLFYSMKAFFPMLKEGGSVIIIGSGSAITGTGGGIQYTASKGGAFGIMRSLVPELGKKGININVIAPRVIESDMLDVLYPTKESKDQLIQLIPIGRLGTPKDISSAVKYLSSENAQYVHGQIILLDGGRTYYQS